MKSMLKSMLKRFVLSLLIFGLTINCYGAWNASLPADDELKKDVPAVVRANWDAIALGTDAALQITNAKVAAGAGIVDTKLATITTANKVNVSAIFGTLGIGFGGTGLTSAGGTANRILGTTNGSSFSLLQVDLASAMITGTLGIGNGGLGLTSAGGVANRVLLTTDGSTFATGQVGLTNMVTGTLPVGNGGTGATAAANAANGVVVNDANGYLVGDGRNLTNLPVTAPTAVSDTDAGTALSSTPATILSVTKTITSGHTVLLIATGYFTASGTGYGDNTFTLKQGSTTVQVINSSAVYYGTGGVFALSGMVTGLSGSVTFSVTGILSGNLTGTGYGNLEVIEF